MRILLIDAQADGRRAQRRVLGETFRQMLCAEAGTLAHALDLVERVRWDVIVLARSMAGTDGVSALRRLRDLAPTAPIVLLDGAEGEAALLVDTVRRVLAGQAYGEALVRPVTER